MISKAMVRFAVLRQLLALAVAGPPLLAGSLNTGGAFQNPPTPRPSIYELQGYVPAALHEAAGDYDTVFESADHAQGGTLRLTLNAKGRGTLKVQLGKFVGGTFVAGLVNGLVVPTGNQTRYQPELTLRRVRINNFTPQGIPFTSWSPARIEGSITVAGQVFTVPPTPVVRPGQLVAPAFPGLYTFFINHPVTTTVPSGVVGVGLAVVSEFGDVRIAGGFLPDHFFTRGGILDAGKRFPFHAALPGYRRLAGTLDFGSTSPVADWQSLSLTYSQMARPGRPAGSASLQLFASRFSPTAELFLPATAASWNLQISDDRSDIVRQVRKTADAKLAVVQMLPEIVKLKHDGAFGFLTGSLRLGLKGRLTELGGVAYQKLGGAVGLTSRYKLGGGFAMWPDDDVTPRFTAAQLTLDSASAPVLTGGSVVVTGPVLGNPSPGGYTGGTVIIGNPGSGSVNTVAAGVLLVVPNQPMLQYNGGHGQNVNLSLVPSEKSITLATLSLSPVSNGAGLSLGGSSQLVNLTPSSPLYVAGPNGPYIVLISGMGISILPGSTQRISIGADGVLMVGSAKVQVAMPSGEEPQIRIGPPEAALSIGLAHFRALVAGAIGRGETTLVINEVSIPLG